VRLESQCRGCSTVTEPLFRIGGNYVTAAGLIAFVVFFAVGVSCQDFSKRTIPAFAHPSQTRKKLCVDHPDDFRPCLHSSFSPSPPLTLPVSHWRGIGRCPAFHLLSFKFSCSLPCSSGSFWISARTKSFLFNRFLVNSGLDRSLQYAISQIVSNIVLVVGVFIVLDNAGNSSRHTDRFCRCSRCRYWLRIAKHRQQFHYAPSHPGGTPDHDRRSGRGGRGRGQVQQIRARSTVILTNDNITMIVPNTSLLIAGDKLDLWRSASAFSHSGRVAYGSDLEKVRNALVEVARENPHVLEDPPPTVFLENVR